MSSDALTLTDLPRAVRAAISTRVGSIRSIRTVEAGHNSPLAVQVTTDAGTLFLKGLRAEGGRLATQQREYEINRYIRGLSPTARWQVRTGGWYVIAFDFVEGRHADYSPGSADLPLVGQLLQRLSHVSPPSTVLLRMAEQRLAAYVTRGEDLRHFKGDSLLHTDLNPHNVLISDRAYLVDWGWATVGARWLDAGYWIIWLIAQGHEPVDAEAVAETVPAWRVAPRSGIDAFAAANVNLWREINEAGNDPWTRRMRDASERWLMFRASAYDSC